jgi:uncharacterized membrane protein
MAKKSDESKVFAVLGVLLTIVGFLIIFFARRNDKYAMYYAKQGLVLFIAFFVIQLLGGVVLVSLFVMPLITWAIGLVLWICYVVLIIIYIIGIINALSGTEKPLPIIGKYGENLKL